MTNRTTTQIYTGRIQDRDPQMIDITIKSASTPLGRLLAPTWAMMNGVKGGSLSPAEYEVLWMRLWWERIGPITSAMREALRSDRIVLACYCRAGDFCHRHLAARELALLAPYHGLRAELRGEVEMHQHHAEQMNLFET